MKDQFRLLTCKAKGLGHLPTEVTINWEGMDIEHMRVLARHAIIHSLQCAWKKQLGGIPEKVEVNAIDFVKGPLHDTLLAIEDRPPPPKPRVLSWMDSLLGDLSPAEKAKLLKDLGEEA